MNDDPTLSPDGARRRDAILADALRVARRRRVRRRTMRAAALVAPIALVVVVFLRPVVKPHAAISPSRVPRVATTRAAPESSIIVAQIVDDPTAMKRHAIASPWQPTSIIVERIDDDELLRELNGNGRQAGLASIGGRQLLLLDGEPIASAR